MNPHGKYSPSYLATLKRDSAEWATFVQWQEARILERLSRYNRMATAKEQLEETGDLTPYQRYKIGTVSLYLLDALARIKAGSYGVCKYCGKEIPVERLLLVPGALQCMECQHKK